MTQHTGMLQTAVTAKNHGISITAPPQRQRKRRAERAVDVQPQQPPPLRMRADVSRQFEGDMSR